jgi:hypothetical protein
VIAEQLLSQIVIYHTVHSADRPIMAGEGGKMGLRGMATCQLTSEKLMIDIPDCADLYEQIHTAYQ